MIPPTYQMKPWITPWIDTRSWAGLSSGYGDWLAGVWASWPEALDGPPGGTGGATSTALSASTWTSDGFELRRTNSSGLTLPAGLDPQGLYASGSSVYDSGVILPSRSLRADPVPIDIVDGGVAVTLGGITHRNTHSRRRQWTVDLLLDGPLDTHTGYSVDVRTKWQQFLARADLGVTVYLWGENWQLGGSQIGPRWAYPGTPNRISGALVDATQVRWTPPSTGILSRYEVSITIAERTAPGRIS